MNGSATVKVNGNDVNVYVPSIASGSNLQFSSEDLHKKFTRGVPDSPSIKKNINAEFFTSIGSNNGRQLYVCVGCNTPLFTTKDLVENAGTATTSSSSAYRNHMSKGNYFYVKQREWMNQVDTGSSTGSIRRQ